MVTNKETTLTHMVTHVYSIHTQHSDQHRWKTLTHGDTSTAWRPTDTKLTHGNTQTDSKVTNTDGRPSHTATHQQHGDQHRHKTPTYMAAQKVIDVHTVTNTDIVQTSSCVLSIT